MKTAVIMSESELRRIVREEVNKSTAGVDRGRIGNTWTPAEDTTLAIELANFLESCGIKHGRTAYAIYMRLRTVHKIKGIHTFLKSKNVVYEGGAK